MAIVSCCRLPAVAAVAAGALLVPAAGTAQQVAPTAPPVRQTLNGPGFAGFAVNNRADLNGDGILDLIVGAPAANPHGRPGAGAVSVVFGPAASTVDLRRLGRRGIRIDGLEAGSSLGRGVATGDVNDDGYDDLITTAPALGSAGYPPPPGGTFVVFGGPGLPNQVDLRRLGKHGFSIDLDGTDVAAGDVNGDGIDDIVVGAANLLGRRGGAIVVFGNRSPEGRKDVKVARDVLRSRGRTSYYHPPGARGFVILPNLAGRGAVGLTTATGDLNGDGYADVILGAPEATHRRRRSGGTVFVVFGGARPESGLLPALGAHQALRILGARAGDEAGRAVAASDLDGDGLDDLVVGAPGAATEGGGRAGEVFVVRGRREVRSGVIDLARWWQDGVGLIRSGARREEAGSSLATADLDGDGREDLLVGAPFASKGSVHLAGRVYWVADPPTGGASLNLGAPGGGSSELFLADGLEAAGMAIDATDALPGEPANVIIGAPLAGSGSISDLGRAYVVQPTAADAVRPVSRTATAMLVPGGASILARGAVIETRPRRAKPRFALRRKRLKVRQQGSVTVRVTCEIPNGCAASVSIILNVHEVGTMTFVAPGDEATKVEGHKTKDIRLQVQEEGWPEAWQWVIDGGERGRAAKAEITVFPMDSLLGGHGHDPISNTASVKLLGS